jgi:hypothetical protein
MLDEHRENGVVVLQQRPSSLLDRGPLTGGRSMFRSGLTRRTPGTNHKSLSLMISLPSVCLSPDGSLNS